MVQNKKDVYCFVPGFTWWYKIKDCGLWFRIGFQAHQELWMVPEEDMKDKPFHRIETHPNPNPSRLGRSLGSTSSSGVVQPSSEVRGSGGPRGRGGRFIPPPSSPCSFLFPSRTSRPKPGRFVHWGMMSGPSPPERGYVI